jgi:uncharacterized protein
VKGFLSLVVDTGFLIALVSRRDKFHRLCLRAFSEHPRNTRYFSVESCLSEACFVLGNIHAISALKTVIETMPLEIVALTANDLSRSFELMRTYADLPMDFADAALVAIAERLNIDSIATTDKRYFAVYRPRHTRSFSIFP